MDEIRDNYFLSIRWELRGWGIYVPGTEKRIAEVPPAWKSSIEAEEIAKHIVELHNATVNK